jgi:hypothetical protein
MPSNGLDSQFLAPCGLAELNKGRENCEAKPFDGISMFHMKLPVGPGFNLFEF